MLERRQTKSTTIKDNCAVLIALRPGAEDALALCGETALRLPCNILGTKND
jgi:hypothetical protein